MFKHGPLASLKPKVKRFDLFVVLIREENELCSNVGKTCSSFLAICKVLDVLSKIVIYFAVLGRGHLSCPEHI